MRKMREVVNQQQGLYRPEFEHDNCGIGAVVNIKGKKTHDTVANALKIVENLEHRAGKDAEGKTGDGVGILLQISHKFFKKVCKKEGFEIGGEREYGVAQLFFHTANMILLRLTASAILRQAASVGAIGFSSMIWYPIPANATEGISCRSSIMQISTASANFGFAATSSQDRKRISSGMLCWSPIRLR